MRMVVTSPESVSIYLLTKTFIFASQTSHINIHLMNKHVGSAFFILRCHNMLIYNIFFLV